MFRLIKRIIATVDLLKLGQVRKLRHEEKLISVTETREVYISRFRVVFLNFPPPTRSPIFFHVILSIHSPSFHLFLFLSLSLSFRNSKNWKFIFSPLLFSISQALLLSCSLSFILYGIVDIQWPHERSISRKTSKKGKKGKSFLPPEKEIPL